MEERPAIAALILAQLRGIDEKGVTGRQQRVGAEPAARQLERLLLGEQQSVLGILRAQIFTELVTEVLRGVATGEYGRWCAAVDRAMVARHQHLHLAPGRLLEHGEERRPAEPLLRELTQRDLVARHLVENGGLRAAVREEVDEVEYKG